MEVFRLLDDRAEQRTPLHALAPERTYRLVNPYTDEAFEEKGSVLMREGLRVSLEKDGALLLRYQPC